MNPETHETTLGKLIDWPAGRDAIHVACAPMIAASDLAPGQHVGIVSNGVAGMFSEPFVGIVDPFLKETVIKGQRFWLVLYPKTVTKIRHHWTHPSFQDHDKPDQPEDFTGAREWITAFAARWEYSFDDFMAGAREYVLKDHELDSNWQNQEETDEEWSAFWEHFHTLTGLSIKDKYKVFVVCCPN